MQATTYLQQFFSSVKPRTPKSEAQAKADDLILSEIADVSRKLENIRNRFNFEIEYDMIESCIFEERALLSRYRHLLNVAREKGVTCTPTTHYITFSQKGLQTSPKRS